MVAYPGLWTGRQPDGSITGEDFILIGTAEYHFVVVETDDTNYPIVRGFLDDGYTASRGEDGWLHFATMGSDGRYLPTNLLVGSVNPEKADYEAVLKPGLKEKRHAIHAQCMQSEYCRWKQRMQQSIGSGDTITLSSGTVANVVIPFRFANHDGLSARPVTSVQDLDQELFNGPQLSVRDYFSQQSYGKLDIISEIVPWVTIPYTEQECANGKSGLSSILHTCLDAALKKAIELLGDGGNVLKASTVTLTFVHSGYAAEFGGNDIDGVWYEDRIWSHAWELNSELYTGRYAIISDKYDRKNNHVNRVGAAVHELAQVLGAPTLYQSFPGYGLGYYDVMANPWGFDGTLVNCGSMSPATKLLFGWIEVEEITSDSGTYYLEQSYSSNKVYVIRRGFPEGEYLILENRQEEGYDQGLSQPGLAIYHVDEKATNVGSYPGHYNFPKDHYRVSLCQGDGRYDLERMGEEGDSGDLFYGGRFSGIGPDGVLLEDGSLAHYRYPNTNSYQGGQEKSSGVTISGISVPDKVMSFQVTFQ
ncbi:protease [Nitzschia inconspicua]|uniref:Protease n=1 Tax=Nitzschia inconspicua TaxID=303405 RepID=A0A9K3L6L1_9STRA|nr:protease [Nitzschia inconspicua]